MRVIRSKFNSIAIHDDSPSPEPGNVAFDWRFIIVMAILATRWEIYGTSVEFAESVDDFSRTRAEFPRRGPDRFGTRQLLNAPCTKDGGN